MLNGGVIIWNQRLTVYRHGPVDWQVQYLGDDHPIALTPDLRGAIEADQLHQRNKQLDDLGS